MKPLEQRGWGRGEYSLALQGWKIDQCIGYVPLQSIQTPPIW